jgi:hypothetical protein
MLENRDDLMSIVVLEAGAAWPPWLTDYQQLAPNAVVIAQAVTEPADAFQSRVLHRIVEARSGSNFRLRVGVIVSADVPAQHRTQHRQNIARGLLKAMDGGREAELVLAGASDEVETTRHDLFTLAGALCGELGGTSINVRVRFSNAKSGVMRAVTASAPDLDSRQSKA